MKRSGKRRHAKTTYKVEGSYLYLVRNHNSSISIVDTLKINNAEKYPYSRYPDGEKFRILDAITPGFKNAYYKESQSWKSKGLTFQWGTTTSASDEFQNTTRFTPSFVIGNYSRKNISSLSIEKGFRFAIRGHGIIYNETMSTSKGIREINTKGKQTTYHLDYFYNLSHRLNSKFSLYYGAILSFRIASHLKYKQETTFTYFSNGTQVQTDNTYVFNNYDPGINILDFYIAAGLKYHYKENFNLSLCYMRDIFALNINLHNQINSGFYLSMELPLWKSMARTKRQTIF